MPEENRRPDEHSYILQKRDSNLRTFPGPIFFGAVIDSTCMVWQEKCNEKTSCWIYDNASLSRNFFFILVAVKLLTSLFFILAYKVYQPPPESQVAYIKNYKDESSSDEHPQGTVIVSENVEFQSD
ncbi:hypothetical protein KUTeg_000474 [Tegillarca granosa]|uniref:Uncharacterized protein n=1 Tax=Tegillarca granosa TaxID=220873 RepID=A0ABQ9G1Z5_TEGGR|nr:hypothetical protein KUTeg_000474 [Tegillarca granosa]